MARQQGFEELDAALESATPVARGREAEGPGETIIEPPVVIDPPDTNGKALATAKGEARRRVMPDTSAIRVSTREDVKALASMLSDPSSSIKISGARTPGDNYLALLAGIEAGLTATQTVKNIMVVNGKPTIWGDAFMALILQHPELAGMEERIEGTGDNRVAITRMVRERVTPAGSVVRIEREYRFSVADARTAGLWGKAGPWKNNPDRMLAWRSKTFCGRDLFADVIGGLGVTEEVQDYSTRPSFDPDRMAVRPGGALERLGEEGTDAP